MIVCVDDEGKAVLSVIPTAAYIASRDWSVGNAGSEVFAFPILYPPFLTWDGWAHVSKCGHKNVVASQRSATQAYA